MHVASIMTDDGLSLFVNGQSYTVPRDHMNYEAIKTALKTHQYDDIERLANPTAQLDQWVSKDGAFRFVGGVVEYQGESFSAAVTDKVLRMVREGLEPDSLLNFLRKVRENPSATAQRELLLFCEANEFLIHEDGDLIAYKSVREDYRDIHSGRFDNSVGQIVTMPRHQVDDRREVTCSFGLHFASYQFASTFAGNVTKHVMVLKINPKDVVSIPHDYNNQKGRCCRYEVIGERTDFTPLPTREVFGGPVELWDEVDEDEDTGFAEDEEEEEDEDLFDEEAVRLEALDVLENYANVGTSQAGLEPTTLDELNLTRSDRIALIADLNLEHTIDLDHEAFGPLTTVGQLLDAVVSKVRAQL